MSNFDPKLMEAWFRLMAEATRSSSTMQESFKRANQGAAPSNDLLKQMGGLLPGKVPVTQEAFAGMTAAYWEALGLVPRSRYDALEREYLELKRKLEEADRTINELHTLLALKGGEEQAQKVLSLWGDTVKTTLKAQTDFLSLWTKGAGRQDGED